MGSPSLSKAFREGKKKEDKIQSGAKVSSLLFHGESSFRKVSTGMPPILVSKAALVI